MSSKTILQTPFPTTQEHELYRVFDSLSFEDEDTHTMEEGFSATGQLSADQTKEIMSLVWFYILYSLPWQVYSMYWMNHSGLNYEPSNSI